MKLSIAAVSALLFAVSEAAADTTSASSSKNPVYKNPKANVDARVADLLKRMTLEDKTSQLVQGDIRNWLDIETGDFNKTGLEWSMATRSGSFYVGVPVEQQWIAENIKVAQDYLVHNTTLGIPAFTQTEGIHGFLIGGATIFNSPIAYACSFNRDLIKKMGKAIAIESAALGVNQIFAPLADLARELRFGRVEETFGEDGFLAGEIGYEFIVGKSSPVLIMELY